MKTWIKLYTKIVDDFDQGTLTWAQRGIWSAMLALCGKIDDRDASGNETGLIDTPESVAWSLRLTAQELDDAMQAFGERGMAEVQDGIVWLPRYGDRQGRKPSDEPGRVAERVKRHRAIKQEIAETFETPCNADVTPMKRPVTRSEEDTEEDTDDDASASSAEPEQERAPRNPENTVAFDTPGCQLLKERLGATAKAQGRRGASKFATLEQKQKFLCAEARLGIGGLASGMDAGLRQGINSVQRMVNWLDKFAPGGPSSRASPGGNGNGRDMTLDVLNRLVSEGVGGDGAKTHTA